MHLHKVLINRCRLFKSRLLDLFGLMRSSNQEFSHRRSAIQNLLTPLFLREKGNHKSLETREFAVLNLFIVKVEQLPLFSESKIRTKRRVVAVLLHESHVQM